VDVDIWVAVIGAVGTFLAGGGVGALISYAIEKRRKRLDRRYALLDKWRDGIASIPDDDDPDGIGDFSISYLRSPWYETLRPHLSKEFLSRYERGRMTVIDSGTGRAMKNPFADEVDRIERKWGLRP
jgi:hypothetical protein